MKKRIGMLTAVFVFCFCMFVTTVSAVRLTKSYRYDYNTITGVSENYHDYQYVYAPNYVHYLYSEEYEVGGGWNYTRYEVLMHFSHGY